MKLAIYPGSFDPVTNGHLDIISRAAQVFDHLIVSVSVNAGKKPLFSLVERVTMLESVLEQYENVSVDCFKGLTVNYANSKDAHVIIRGLRAISDFENEFQMALTNKKLRPEIETIFMMAQAQWSFISSSLVREVASYGGSVLEFVPPVIEKRLMDKYAVPVE